MKRYELHRDAPPIVFANIGTTMKGAIDDLSAIRSVFKDLAIHRFYIHADAALAGMILPFLDNAPPWNFTAGIDSLAVSGHKMVGSPIPCGIVLARRRHVDRIARHVEYVGSLDTTISGSRNGLTPLILWYAWQVVGPEGFRRKVRHCLAMADYAIRRLRDIGRHPWRHPHSITVVFERPSIACAERWQLAVQDDIAHLITMPQTTPERIDAIVSDLAADTSDGREEKWG
jgi:histidine decarboxylase